LNKKIDNDVSMVSNFVINCSFVSMIYGKFSWLRPRQGLFYIHLGEMNFHHIKTASERMVIKEDWQLTRENDTKKKKQRMKDLKLNDLRSNQIGYFSHFIS